MRRIPHPARSLTLVTFLAALAAACGEQNLSSLAPEDAPIRFAPPGACDPWPECRDGGDDGDDDGSTESAIELVFPDDEVFDSFGIATTGSGTTDLTGENTADWLEASGSYSLVYETTDCPEEDHPLVALFNAHELNTSDFSMKLDKEADENGYDFNDRIRVDLNDLQHPDGDDGFVYSVWFRGRPNDPNYDPDQDVQISEGSDWTSVEVTNEDVFVRQLECRGRSCNSVEVVDRDRCELAADYSLKASK